MFFYAMDDGRHLTKSTSVSLQCAFLASTLTVSDITWQTGSGQSVRTYWLSSQRIKLYSPEVYLSISSTNM